METKEKHTPEIKHHKQKLAILCVKDHREIGYWTGDPEPLSFKILTKTIVLFSKEDIDKKFETWKEWMVKRGEPGIEMYVVPIRTDFETSAERDELRKQLRKVTTVLDQVKNDHNNLVAERDRLKELYEITLHNANTIADERDKAEQQVVELQAINSELLEALKDNYLRLQIIANSNVLFAATTDSLRASMRNKISKITGQSSQTIQEENESQAIAKATK